MNAADRLGQRLGAALVRVAHLETALEELQAQSVGMMAVLTQAQKKKLGIVSDGGSSGGGGKEGSVVGDTRRT